MHPRKSITSYLTPGLISILLFAALFIGVGTTLAENSSQETGPTEAELDSGEIFLGSSSLNSPEVIEGPDEPLATGYWHKTGLVFYPWSSSTTYSWSSIGCKYITGGSLYLFAELDLPHNAVVTYMRMYYIDNDGSNDSYLTLWQFNDGASNTSLGSVNSTGAQTYARSVSKTMNVTIDNLNYSYGFEWDSHSSANTMRICGVRVNYTIPLFGSALPIIKR
ncbi:MAG: hypothetical protein JW704_08685 [Anaerolineaceae bacterium]|nr:hypothetical protein [Anaerolineaceae bacterium]MBN2678096.1 hypothetical protein [Anaerolineaceae bacterium]